MTHKAPPLPPQICNKKKSRKCYHWNTIKPQNSVPKGFDKDVNHRVLWPVFLVWLSYIQIHLEMLILPLTETLSHLQLPSIFLTWLVGVAYFLLFCNEITLRMESLLGGSRATSYITVPHCGLMSSLRLCYHGLNQWIFNRVRTHWK